MKKINALKIYITTLILIIVFSIVILIAKANVAKNNKKIEYNDRKTTSKQLDSKKEDNVVETTNNEIEPETNKQITINSHKSKTTDIKQMQTQSEKTMKTEETKVLTLNSIANEVAKNNSNVKRIEYGTSVQGRPLEAYLITGNGSNKKTIFMEFEVHGYEDEFSKDGTILVKLANELVQYYANNSDTLRDYRMIIVPSANPDGVIDGKNNLRAGSNNAFGRCTAEGIDINRDFKLGCFKAIESQKLRNLMDIYPMDIHLDFHGWEDSCIGNPIIVNTFLSEVGLTTNKSNRYGNGQGYVIEYTRDTYGANSAIVEFRNSNSVNTQKVEKAINILLKEI